VNILEAFDDPHLFGPLIPKGDWAPWRAFLAALFALPPQEGAGQVFEHSTNRGTWPVQPFSEAWLICGRRAGKSFVLALVAVFLAAFGSYDAHLGPGERATVMLIAADRRQARVLLRYIRGLLSGVPMLARLIEAETAERIDLTNRVSIEIATASFRTSRGYSLVASLGDEVAFWGGDDAASPDTEILHALRPALATIPGAMLLCASSPYGRRGAMWSTYKRHFGRDDAPVLVWKASTRFMRPDFPQQVVDDAMADDPAAANAEYNAEFRADVETFLDREVFLRCVPDEEAERQPLKGVKYFAFVDPSGGSSDSMTLAIAHRDDRSSVLDMVREVTPPFSPETVVTNFVADLKRYGLREVTGDRYAGEWVREPFARHGISYKLSEQTKNEIYQTFLPLVNSRQVELLDNSRMVAQFLGLDRRTGKYGRDSVDHAPGAHDDLANAAAGALVGVVPNTIVGNYAATGSYRMRR